MTDQGDAELEFFENYRVSFMDHSTFKNLGFERTPDKNSRGAY